jgi:UDP-glucose:(heptosyl)LPS alpha-1,3-glucosyltransferase
MRIAFAITKLFSGGGLQRDCVEIAREISRRGNVVVVFTAGREGDFPDDLAVAVLPVKRRTNHGRQAEFAAKLREVISSQKFDLVVGFDKLDHLDVLYCADPSIRARMLRSPWLFLLPRYRTFHALERALFAPAGGTRLLMLSQRQSNDYQSAWHTEPERLTLLPPTVAAARRRPGFRGDGVGARLRASLGLTPQDWVWLAVGAKPHTKGLDRSIRAMREYPRARLVVAGLSRTGSRAARAMATQASRLGVADRILWAGHREDIPELMAAVDLLVHPARNDTTGTVILEAVVNGLPVITTAVCGYAAHVTAAETGIVIDEPFAAKAYLAALAAAQETECCTRWSAAGVRYGEQPFLYQGRLRAVELILAAAADHAARREAVDSDGVGTGVANVAARVAST